MQRLIMGLIAIILMAGATAQAGDNALGFYFSNTEFTRESASGVSTPGFNQLAYIVLTNATGTTVSGYEVSIAATAPDFAIVLTDHPFENAGTNMNHLVTFSTPLPVDPNGTVLTMCIFGMDSMEYTEISFGPSDPSSLPDTPTVTFTDAGLVPATFPFESSVVAWLNEDPVASEAQSWSGVKALFQ